MLAPTIKSVMTPFPYSVGLGDSALIAREMMRSHEIHHLPVKSGDSIVGVVSAGDLRHAGSESDSVGDLMQTDHYVAELGASLEDVLVQMAQRRLECVVVTKEGRLAGIVTTVDVCRAYAETLARQRADGDDAA